MTSVPFALAFAAIFGVMGLHLPYWQIFLQSRGMSETEIGFLSAIGLIGWTVAAIGGGMLADRTGRRRGVTVTMSCCAPVAALLFWPDFGFWGLAIASLAFVGAFNALIPMVTNLTLNAAKNGHLDYGRTRLWGSFAFVISVIVIGHLLDEEWITAPDLVWALVVGAIAASIFIYRLSATDTTPAPREETRLRDLLRHPAFWLFLTGPSLIQASHGTYYAVGTLHWLDAGLSNALIGWLWAEAVLAEIILFALAFAIAPRLGAIGLMALGAIGGTVRWIVMGMTIDPSVMILVQALHAFSFGATHLGAMRFLGEAIPQARSATAQGVYTAASMAFTTGLGSIIGATLYEYMGWQWSFWAMALLSASGGLAIIGLSRIWDRDVIHFSTQASS